MKLNFFFKTAVVFFSLFRLINLSPAQVCSGALGDPVVNVDFGYGSGPANPLQGAATSYSFTTSSCPDDGSYTIVNGSSGCFNNTWHSLSHDHTLDGANGYMMLVNASYNPGDFYIDTVRNLCANTTYEFAAWIVNVLRPSACGGNGITPDLTFAIETISGTPLGTYTTGHIFATPDVQWNQYGLFFTTPVNTNSIVIRITNNAPGGCGNDLALDDITFRPCGPTVTTALAVNNETKIDLCREAIPNLLIVGTIGNGYVDPAGQWQVSIDEGNSWRDIPGETGLNYVFNQTGWGNYKYRLSVADGSNINISSCRVASNSVDIVIHDFPVVEATSNSPVCESSAIQLSASGGISYSWSGPAGFSDVSATASLIAEPGSGGEYRVEVTDEFGCRNTAAVTVVTNPKPVATVSEGQTFCEGNAVSLQAGGGIAYLWSPSAGLSNVNISNPIANTIDTTVYNVFVTGANNCLDTATVTLNVLKKPMANAGPDQVLIKGQQVILAASVAGSDISYSWSPASFLNDPTLLQPVSAPPADIVYRLTVVSLAGCGTASDEVALKVFNDIYVPNAFTPNNDGLNDSWRIEGLVAAPNAHLWVFDRFGNKVFESTANGAPWDGTYKGLAASAGAYAYVLDLKNGLPLRKGMVMIVR